MGVPAVIICSLDHAVAALNAAREQGSGLLLLSPPGAASSTGASLFKAMVHQAKKACPDVPFDAALDCGHDAGHALAAIRQGIKGVILSEDCPARERVRNIARQNDTQLLSPDIYHDKGLGAPLDLTKESDPLAVCRAFLHMANVSTHENRVLS